ncbi:hypothetical protein I0C86_25140 [Plantactinospora sp. S1510]|uniref:Uncharacterized protein n=1 Tax=Plantactinospora alkalitolerans TaxID=2789879 RepID=A0ABS0H190_9ACTN|nr:hypothetical protein [Plantactinospora alkalitolerans]MBF9132210.1 hypothetical protein [Plantactinospora alkalitolerans]
MTEILDGYAFERLLALPALPADNATDHQYATKVTTDSGESWSLRSMSTCFSLVARPWLRFGLTRCYSLGWGLVNGRQTHRLVLAQAFGTDQEALDDLATGLTEALRGTVSGFECDVTGLWDRWCLRLAAEVADAHG